MTYKQLSEAINKMTEEQQNSDVTVYDTASDEYFPSERYDFADGNGEFVLDVGHPLLIIN